MKWRRAHCPLCVVHHTRSMWFWNWWCGCGNFHLICDCEKHLMHRLWDFNLKRNERKIKLIQVFVSLNFNARNDASLFAIILRWCSALNYTINVLTINSMGNDHSDDGIKWKWLQVWWNDYCLKRLIEKSEKNVLTFGERNVWKWKHLDKTITIWNKIFFLCKKCELFSWIKVSYFSMEKNHKVFWEHRGFFALFWNSIEFVIILCENYLHDWPNDGALFYLSIKWCGI